MTLLPAVFALALLSPLGPWRAELELAGGPLRFGLEVQRQSGGLGAKLCNGPACSQVAEVRSAGDSIVFDIADYAATITVVQRGDSLVGEYHNVGRRGPRTIPFRAARGRWSGRPAPARLLGRWDASLMTDFDTSPRVFEFSNGAMGFEGTIISNSGDYGTFAGSFDADSFALSHFDGSYVYLLTGRIQGDTLRGIFHAGLRTQTPFFAVRSTGASHLKLATQITAADTAPFRFSFPDLQGQTVTELDPRFAGKVLLVDAFGTWCPNCHDAAPVLVKLYREFHGKGLEIVGLAYEVTGDSTIDAPLVRRYRDRYGIAFPLLLAGTNDTEAAAATLPQLRGFTAFPTTLFIGRDGRVRRVHAGFTGPATGEQYARVVREFREEVERLLSER